MKKYTKLIAFYSIIFFILDTLFLVVSYGFKVVEIALYYYEIKYLWPYFIAEEYLHHIIPLHGHGLFPEPTIFGYLCIFFGILIGLYLNYIAIDFYLRRKKK